MTTKIFPVNYYETKMEVFWPLRLEKPENLNVKKLKKMAKTSKKC